RNDTIGAQQKRTLDGELSYRTAPPHGDRFAALQIAKVGRHETGREDVGQKQDLFVAKALRHLNGSDVGVGYAEVLCLATGVASQHVRVAEQTCRRMSPQLLGHLVVWVRPLAARKEALLAEEAFAAGDRERHDYPVPDLELLVLLPDLDDLT